MTTQETNQQLWELAIELVHKRQDEAWEELWESAVEEHCDGGCWDCRDGLSPACERSLLSSLLGWQEKQFDDLAEAEYYRLLGQVE